MDYIIHEMNRTYNKLRRMIKQHANTFVTRYKWCHEITLEESRIRYVKMILEEMPDTWSKELEKTYAKIYKKYEVRHVFNITMEAQEIFTKCWYEIDVKPKWLIIQERDAQTKNQ